MRPHIRQPFSLGLRHPTRLRRRSLQFMTRSRNQRPRRSAIATSSRVILTLVVISPRLETHIVRTISLSNRALNIRIRIRVSPPISISRRLPIKLTSPVPSTRSPRVSLKRTNHTTIRLISNLSSRISTTYNKTIIRRS